MFSGIKCHVCGIAAESPEYLADHDMMGRIRSVYWANPKLTELTDVVLNFCGAVHSTQWFTDAAKAKEVATHDDDQEQSQPAP